MSAVIVGFFTLMIMAGRIMQQEADVRSAANAGARAGSLRNTYAQGRADAQAVAAQNLVDSGVTCESQNITVSSAASDFIPTGFITVRVECTARSIGSFGLGPNVFWYEATEVIDDYRGEP